MNSGILIINKPAGPTSHDIVDKIRGITGIKKVGHAGTLDPFAEGVLIILIEKATKSQSKFMEMPKTYVADIELSETRTPIVKSRVSGVLKTFIGETEQIPPIYSAIKIKGRKAYELARKGIKPKLKPRKVKIYEVELRKYKWPELEIKVKCGKGTYIRSLAHDIGQKLGCGAYLKNLTRTQIGKYNIDNSIKPDKLNKDNWKNYLIYANN